MKYFLTDLNVFGLKFVFFELLHAKPCRTIMKLLQKVSFGPEACEIEPKSLTSVMSGPPVKAGGSLRRQLGEPWEGGWQSQPFKDLYKNPLEIPEGIPS